MAKVIKKNDLSAIKDSGDTFVINNSTGKVMLYIPYANSATYTLKGDKVSATAKGEDVVDFQQPSTFDIEYSVQLMNLDLIAFISGSEIGEATKKFIKREVFDITESNKSKVDILGTPAGGKVQIFTILKDNGGTHIKEIEGTVESKTVNFTTPLTVGDRIAIYYYEEKLCRYASIKATPDKSSNYTIDSIVSMKSSADTGEKSYMNLVIPKTTVSQDLALTFDSTKPSEFTIKFSASKNAEGQLYELREIPVA